LTQLLRRSRRFETTYSSHLQSLTQPLRRSRRFGTTYWSHVQRSSSPRRDFFLVLLICYVLLIGNYRRFGITIRHNIQGL
jgi:hypothetical protein